MKVSELIERLQRCDPDRNVRIAWTHHELPHYGTELVEVVAVGTDNAPSCPEVLVSNRAMPSLVLPR